MRDLEAPHAREVADAGMRARHRVWPVRSDITREYRRQRGPGRC